RTPIEIASIRELLPDVPFQHLAPHNAAVDVAFSVHAHGFRTAVIDGGRFHILDELLHRASFRAADADAFLPARLVRPPRLGVGDIHRVVSGDEDSTWASPLSPGLEILSILIKNLDAIVRSIADE